MRLEFKLQDMWIGAFWKPGHLWVCILPCLPLHFIAEYRGEDGDQVES